MTHMNHLQTSLTYWTGLHISFYFTLSYLTTLSKLGLFIPKDFGTIIIILHGVLHKAEAVHITNKGVAIGPQEVEPTHGLLQEEAEDLGFRHTGRKQWGTAATLAVGHTLPSPALLMLQPSLHTMPTSQAWNKCEDMSLVIYTFTAVPKALTTSPQMKPSGPIPEL